jgi:hypothetical protein
MKIDLTDSVEKFKKEYRINSQREAVNRLRESLMMFLEDKGLSLTMIGDVFRITKQGVSKKIKGK